MSAVRGHDPFPNDGVDYCGWTGDAGTIGRCGWAWPCPTVRARERLIVALGLAVSPLVVVECDDLRDALEIES